MSFGFDAVVGRIERRLVAELALEAQPLPRELARLDGSFRGEPATLVARAYAGPRLGYVRCVEVTSRHLDIGNVLALPRREYALPVLGVDLVEVGRDTAVVVADLSPMSESASERAHELAVLARHRPPRGVGAGGEPPDRELPGCELPGCELPGCELPEWAREWFSPAALSVRVDSAQAPASVTSVEAYVSAFVELCREALPDAARADSIARRQRAYAAAHRERDRGLLLLRRIFDPALADRFLQEVLFPDEPAALTRATPLETAEGRDEPAPEARGRARLPA